MDKSRFAVLTSGGDAPGMNAAIRAVVRTGIHLGREIVGINDGFRGLLDAKFRVLSARDVGGIIQQGGTILGSARCPEFKSEDGIQKARSVLQSANIRGLIVIGGNGSQTGAAALSLAGFPVVGIASTIDNDLCGTDISIGVDTALNIALEAIARFNAQSLGDYFKTHQERLRFDVRVITLGRVQRGGAPGAFDRLLATRLGVAAMECLDQEVQGVLVGWQKGQIACTPYAFIAGKTKGIDNTLVRMIEMLAA